MKLDLLANATCYGDKAFISEQKLDFFANLDEMKKAGVMPEIITTTSPYLAVIARRYSKDIERRASVNMRLNSTIAMEYVSREFDSFYICRDLQRDLPTVKMFAEWAKRNGKTICMLANSGCLRYCPWQTFHETLLSHRSMSDPVGEQRKGNEESKRIGLPGTLCLDICKNKRFEEFLRGSWIRPEDLHLYEPYFSVIKLSTREADRPDLILRAYISGSHDGDLLQILDPGYSVFVSPDTFDNKSFPPEWSEGKIAGLCASNCTHCGKCTEVMNLVFKRDPNRAVRSSYSFPPEKPLMPGC